MHRLDIPTSLTGLREKFRRIASPESEVDRPLSEVLRPEFLAGMKRLDLIARILVKGFLQGLHRTPRRGFSPEFSEYRNFVYGEDPRWIDWRLYARTDRLFIKRFEAESAMRATLVVDGSASMGYCSPKRPSAPAPVFTKLGYASTLAAAFTLLLQRQRDRVGLLLIRGGEDESKSKNKSKAPKDDGRLYLPPRSSRNHVNRLMQLLSGAEAGGSLELPVALKVLADQDRRKGLIVICSDGLCGRASLEEALKRLRYRGHDVIFFQIWDPAELDPPDLPATSFRDPESKKRFNPLPREEYQRRSREHLSEIRRLCLASGCEYQFLQTTMAFDQALYRFLHLRKRRH